MSYRARDGQTYSHRETPEEYRRRKSGGSGDYDGCGCLIAIVLLVLIFG